MILSTSFLPFIYWDGYHRFITFLQSVRRKNKGILYINRAKKKKRKKGENEVKTIKGAN
jgi:hypothetical protein